MSKRVKYFDKQDLNDIFNGVVLLASGGGGSKVNGADLMKDIFTYADKVPYISHKNIKKNEYAPVLAAMGAPDAFKKVGFDNAPKNSLLLHQTAIQKNFMSSGHSKEFTFDYTIPVESGVIAFFMSMLVSVQEKLPIVDGDGGGRAFPSLAMCTFAADNVSVSPAALVSEASVSDGGTSLMFNQNESSKIDDITRQIIGTSGFNDVSSLSSFCMDGETIKKSVVPETITRARKLGKLIRETDGNPLNAVLKFLGAKLLFSGKVTSISEITRDGFDFGTVDIKNPKSKAIATVCNQNENLIAWSNDCSEPLAMAPDSICYMDNKGKTYSNADLVEGQFVYLIGIPAVKEIQNDYFRTIFDTTLKSLGYYGPYVPVEKLICSKRKK